MDPLVKSLLATRGLTPPAEDEVPLEEHWKKMRRLRSDVDEVLLADNEVAVTWTAVQGERS
jgi:hypothetical protein